LSKDPLSSVESLVGPINNNDVIKQEITEYQRKGTELKEMGTAQNKRIMIKYLKILKYKVRSDYSGSALFRNFL